MWGVNIGGSVQAHTQEDPYRGPCTRRNETRDWEENSALVGVSSESFGTGRVETGVIGHIRL